MSAAAEWQVEPLPPQPDPSANGDVNGEGATPPPASAEGVGGGEWTPADIEKLKSFLRAPYRKAADATGDEWLALNELEEAGYVMSLTSWMPVEWIRETSGTKIPPIVGIGMTAAVLLAVNVGKWLQWNRMHPDRAVPIPFLSRMNKGVPRGQPARAAARPDRSNGAAPSPEPSVEQPGGPGGESDVIEAQQPVAARGDSDKAPAGEFPSGDSVDDIQRQYGAGR